jgi:hypothetical protein
MFPKSVARSDGLRAKKTTVASPTPKRAIHATSSEVTVMKATVPLPLGPSARAIRSKPTNRPAFPTT